MLSFSCAAPMLTPFHPELRTSAALFRFFLPLGLLRALLRLRGVPRPPRLPGLDIRDRHIPARDGETLRVRIYRRAGSTERSPALLWIHGGGYVMGSPELHEKSSVDFARTLGVTAVTYGNRLSADGVPCKLHVVPGAYHGFDVVKSSAGATRAFRAQYLAALAGGLDLEAR